MDRTLNKTNEFFEIVQLIENGNTLKNKVM